SGAEVVDRDADTDILQLPERRYGEIAVDETALRHLDEEVLRLESSAGQYASQHTGRFRRLDVGGRQVDREQQVREAGQQCAGRVRRQLRSPPRDPPDETRFFSDRDEEVRPNRLAVRAAPPKERLDPEKSSRRKLHDWFVDHGELIPLECALQQRRERL